MFTQKAQAIIDRAKDYAFSSGDPNLTVPPLLHAVLAQTEAASLLAECLGISVGPLRELLPGLPVPVACPGKLHMDDAIRSVLTTARRFAEDVPDPARPGLIDIRHIAAALASSQDACATLHRDAVTHESAASVLRSWYARLAETPAIQELTERVRGIRTSLLTRIFGQDSAVHAFVEGLFNAEVVAAADVERMAPKAIFVFAGPPGVGKTFLAIQGALLLDRPFRRFDMSAFSGHQQHEALVGLGKGYHGAQPGQLTEFVEKNPSAVLLFDEIEKAHSKTIQLFLQILDGGTLEDKYYERNVSFRDTVVIFTTNAGRKLYERQHAGGVHPAHAAFHRQTILDALEAERDPETRQPIFPGAICSRMATGYPVLFNYLRINELERVVRTELLRVGALLERQYYKQVRFDDVLPMALVLREGARADARALRSQAEAFLKSELFKFCQLFKTDRLEEVMEQVDCFNFRVGEEDRRMGDDVSRLFEAGGRPRLLLVADSDLCELYREEMESFEWRTATEPTEALRLLAAEDFDVVLVDLWLGRSSETGLASTTIAHFDHVPAAARGLERGQEVLRAIRERLPHVPVILLSFSSGEEDNEPSGSVDDELFLACMRAGGARGMLSTGFIDRMVDGWEEQRDACAGALRDICARLYREKVGDGLAAERKVLAFDTAPRVDMAKREITVNLRNLRVARAIAAADAGEILDDVERPRTTFAEVIGATAAKEELKFYIDYLKNPRRFLAMGLTPPRGVLLYGPPGTGKTMLARAMAGESDVAFIPASAPNFVTVWQGSGPQSIRDLFGRARRYAPAIIFIDEIDAIGKIRSGSAGGGRAEENTLNSLLTEMDGFSAQPADRPVFVLAATNFAIKGQGADNERHDERMLDPALVRRFSRAIRLDRPDAAARREYLVRRLGNADPASITDDVISLIAEKSAGMGISDLEQVIEAAGRKALRDGDGNLTPEILVEAFDTTRVGEVKTWDPHLLEQTARHEAGHTVMYWLSGWWATQVDIIARAEYGGGMLRCEAEMKRESRTRAELLAQIRTSLAGRAAEILAYGPEAGLTTGAWGDLDAASHLARLMVCRYGMDDEFGLQSIPENFSSTAATSGAIFERISATVERMLRREMQNALAQLEAHRVFLDAVTAALVKKNRLYRRDLEALLPALPQRRPPDEPLK